MKYINAELFRSILKEHDMTITSFSKESGIPRDSINNWLYRGVKIPEWKAEMMSEFFMEQFGKTYDDLFI